MRTEATSIRQLNHSPTRLHQCLRRISSLVLPERRTICRKIDTLNDKKIKLMLNNNSRIALWRIHMHISKWKMVKDKDMMNINKKIKLMGVSLRHL